MSDIHKQSQVVLHSITEDNSHGAFEVWSEDGIAVCVPKEMAAQSSKLSQHSFWTQSGNLPIAVSMANGERAPGGYSGG
jgi:hypothetical protein